MAFGSVAGPAEGRDRWTADEANDWGSDRPWLVGCNFTPSTAINQLEMWQPETFDPETIDRELGWAESLGFNSVRVYLHNLLWDQDREGFIKRIDTFLEIADKHGIGVMMVPLDGVWDPQPKLGRQREPKPHLHNSGWMQAPGSEILGDPERHDELKPFIQGLIAHYRDDDRIQVWDLFNEGDNPNANSYGENGDRTELPQDRKSEMAIVLTKKLFEWARAADPSQPLTSGIWRGDWSSHESMDEFSRLLIDESDVISFHNYDGADDLKNRIGQLRRYGRPLFCTEFMARPNDSFFDPHLGIMKDEKVGAYCWGFVAGKSQTIYPWETWRREFTSEPDVWFHDIFREDGTPFREQEVEYIRNLTGAVDAD
ncbi:cellulase family glycosylhydrolase [soil metagenome]